MTNYRRNPTSVLAQLVTNSAGQVLTRQKLFVYLPVRFAERELAEISAQVTSVGMLCFMLESGEYSVMNVMSRLKFSPKRVTKVAFEEVEYYQLEFDPNSVVITSTSVLRDNTVIYPLLDEFIFRGKVPWYFEYDDLLRMFDTADSHASSRTGEVPETMEAIISIIARSPKDRKILMRHMLGGKPFNGKLAPAWVPLASVQYSVANPLSKFAGGYFNDGVVSALVSPSDTVSSIEKVLRS